MGVDQIAELEDQCQLLQDEVKRQGDLLADRDSVGKEVCLQPVLLHLLCMSCVLGSGQAVAGWLLWGDGPVDRPP